MTAILPVSNNETPALSDASWRAVGILSALLDDSEVITPQHIRAAMTDAFGADEAGGAWDWRLSFDCLEAAAWLFLRRWWGAMESRATSSDAMLAMLERISGLMPTQSRRSEEQNALQQFSTPLPLAWLARLAADIKIGDAVLEPSAGTGALAIHAELAGARLVLNEIGEARRGILDKLFPDVPLTNHHAAYIHGLMASEPLVDVVLMNPPFSTDPAKPGHKSSDETLRHFRAAFQRLKPGGRCVIITGGGTSAASLVKGLDEACARFSAVMDGAVYAKHGTRFPTAIHVIDKVEPLHTDEPIVIEDKPLTEIAAMLETLPAREKPQAQIATLGLFDEDEPNPISPLTATPLAYEPNATPLSAIHSEGIFQPWQAGAVHIPAAKPHPSILAEAVAMAAIRPPLPNYQPHLPAYLIDEGVLSNAQLETIIHAGEAHQRIMPQRFTFDDHAGEEIIIPSTKEGEGFQLRQGYFLGDGTGAGKGRQAAGIVLDNWLQGRTKAVWFSKSDKLIEDARRDWRDVGGKDTDIVSLSKYRQGAPITMQNGILFATYATLRSGARNGKASRLQQICDWLGSDFDGVILFDEAHALAGAGGGEKSERGSRAPSKQGVAGLALQNLVPLARVVYVSATGASSVNALAYASRLGLWAQPSIPFATRKDFVSAMDAGGVAAAEIVARDLKVLGLYNARSLSYEGVEVDILASPLNDDQKPSMTNRRGRFTSSIIIWKRRWKALGLLIPKGRPAIKTPKPPRVLPLKALNSVSSATS